MMEEGEKRNSLYSNNGLGVTDIRREGKGGTRY